MHDKFSKADIHNEVTSSAPCRLNDCFIDTNKLSEPKMLFDAFWLEGELALLFGATGTGKSILALQIADSAARGRCIEGFRMDAKRAKVLYVDLIFSQVQINMRYMQSRAAKHHEFSQNLYRDRPDSTEKLCEWVRKRVLKYGYRVVMIDDINAVSQSCDGTRETLKLMRDLKRLKDQLEISVLVLAGSRQPPRRQLVSEADLQRSRVLCEVADSTFALGRNPQTPEGFYLIQTRSRSAPIVWRAENAPLISIERSEDGCLRLKFDKRFLPEVDEKMRQLICNVKWRRDVGAKFREIAEELGISVSRAFELNKKWRPELDPPKSEFQMEQLPVIEAPSVADAENDAELRRYEEEVGLANDPDEDVVPETDATLTNSSQPYAASAASPALLSHLKRSWDKNYREIFVEHEDENGKPIVWYMYDTTGQLIRYEFKGVGATGRHVDGPICLFNTS